MFASLEVVVAPRAVQARPPLGQLSGSKAGRARRLPAMLPLTLALSDPLTFNAARKSVGICQSS